MKYVALILLTPLFMLFDLLLLITVIGMFAWVATGDIITVWFINKLMNEGKRV